MKKTTAGLLAMIAAAATATTASAQATTPLSVEVRAGVSVPTGDLADDVDAGLTVSGDLMYQVTPMVGLYAGYNYNRYAFKDTDGVNADIRGFEGGARVQFPSPNFSPFFKGGVLYQQSAISGDGGSISSDYEFGFSLGGGVDVPVGSRVSFTPQLDFNHIKDAEYVNVQAGLRIRL
jgi:hypothetical protein